MYLGMRMRSPSDKPQVPAKYLLYRLPWILGWPLVVGYLISACSGVFEGVESGGPGGSGIPRSSWYGFAMAAWCFGSTFPVDYRTWASRDAAGVVSRVRPLRWIVLFAGILLTILTSLLMVGKVVGGSTDDILPCMTACTSDCCMHHGVMLFAPLYSAYGVAHFLWYRC